MQTFLHAENISNLFDFRQVSHQQIESEIEGFTLSFPSLRDDEVEWKLKLPTFLDAFYNFYFFNHRIPKQQELWEYYLRLNPNYFNDKQFSPQKLNAIQARVFRTYPSLVRDLHFGAYINEVWREIKVIYNRKLDVEMGIDILLVSEERLFAVLLFTNTGRSIEGARRKQLRHWRFENVRYVELPIQMNDCFQCGEFFLYREKQLAQLKAIVALSDPAES